MKIGDLIRYFNSDYFGIIIQTTAQYFRIYTFNITKKYSGYFTIQSKNDIKEYWTILNNENENR